MSEITYVSIPGAKFNSVRLTVPCFSNPYFIKSINGGCLTQLNDQCLVDTAMASALLNLMRENLIQILSQKLIQVSLSYYISYGYLHICMTLPASVGTIKYGLKCIRKTISPLLAKRTSKLYYKIKKDAKKDASLVNNTIAKNLNGNIQIVVYGRSKQDTKFIKSLHSYTPKPLEHTKESINRVQSMIGAEGPYRPMKHFDSLSDTAKAILISAFQIANFDFFTDATHKNIFINKQHFNNPQLVSVRKFIESKTKFLFKNNSKTDEKAIVSLLSSMYNHSATAIQVNKDMILEDKTKKDITALLANFQERFPKTTNQL